MNFIRFKDNEKFATKGAETSPFHDSFDSCGYLLEKDDLILDIDNMNKESIREMLRIFNINTQTVETERGYHLYFSKPRGFKAKAKAATPIGVEMEFKTIDNTPFGITIKKNGVLRTIINIGVRQELPDFLVPHNKYADLLGLDEGDGRNQKLYAQKFRIMHVDNYKRVLRFINDHVFAAPLPEDELLTISREEEIKAEKDGEFDVAMQLIRKLNIVEFADRYYFYDGKRYKTGNLKREIAQYLKGQKSHYIDEVMKQIELHPNIVEQPEKGFDIKFKNGILRNGKFIEVDSMEFTPYYIDIEYNPEAEPVQVVDDYINQLTEGDKEYNDLLFEMMAHPLITNVEKKRKLARFSIIIGKGGEGKGTLLEIIGRILGRDNCSFNKISKLPDERYAYDIEGKLANLGDDIEDKPISNAEMEMLKNISTCDPVMVRALHKMARNTRLTASLIFTSNHMLKTHEKGDSYKRRVQWCPMFNKPQKSDGEIISKLTSEAALEYWVKLIMEAYFRLYKTETFTPSKKVDEYTAQYHDDNNTCLLWVRDRKPDLILNKRAPEVYAEYESWALENDDKAQSPRALKNTIESELGFVIKPRKQNGKTQKVYVNLKQPSE